MDAARKLATCRACPKEMLTKVRGFDGFSSGWRTGNQWQTYAGSRDSPLGEHEKILLAAKVG
jgi:hypothetical protein